MSSIEEEPVAKKARVTGDPIVDVVIMCGEGEGESAKTKTKKTVALASGVNDNLLSDNNPVDGDNIDCDNQDKQGNGGSPSNSSMLRTSASAAATKSTTTTTSNTRSSTRSNTNNTNLSEDVSLLSTKTEITEIEGNGKTDILVMEENKDTIGSSGKLTAPLELEHDGNLGKQLMSLTEPQAGITEYIGNHSGFSAIIKQRYSDFIVHEVDQAGHIVHLTDLSVPQNDEQGSTQEDRKPEAKQESGPVSAESLLQLDELVQATDRKGSVKIDAPDDKEKRTCIHLYVKKNFPQLETITMEEDNKKFIKAMWKKASGRGRPDDQLWPASQKACPYVKFVLYKENKDTNDTIGLIAKTLHLKENLFQFAGTKDRRGKTTQEVTARKIHPRKLACLNKVLFNIALGNFRYVKEPLKLGQLSGNHFIIVLRNVQGSTVEVDTALTSLKSQGFINYFGLQRFGTTSIPTYDIGRALLKADWQSAIDLILMPRNDQAAKDKFQQVWARTHDPVATLKEVPTFCGLERNLLEGLRKNMKPLNCLDKIHRNTRLLYVHSYQSRVWNLMASRRLRHFGHQVVPGDLVLPNKQSGQGEGYAQPTVVTADTVEDFTLQDVVLPLPGHDVIYPHNEVKDWYKETLEQDGLDIDNMKRPQKDFSLPGAYRPLTVLPSDVTWEQCCYDDYTVALTSSDMDALKGVTAPERRKQGGKLQAVVLELSLPQSCYATMALREVLRQDTSTNHQASLNVT